MALFRDWLKSGVNSLTWGVFGQYTTPMVVAALEAWYLQHRGVDWGLTLILALLSFGVAFVLVAEVKRGVTQPAPRGRNKTAKGKPWSWLAIIILLGGFLIFDVIDRVSQYFLPIVNPAREKAAKIAAPQIAGRPWASEEELKQFRVTDRTFFIYDVPRDEDNRSINHRFFERCTILGPAILYLDASIATESIFASDVGGLDSILWPKEVGPASGLFVMRGCTIKNCTTLWIGFAGNKETVERIKKDISGR